MNIILDMDIIHAMDITYLWIVFIFVIISNVTTILSKAKTKLFLFTSFILFIYYKPVI